MRVCVWEGELHRNPSNEDEAKKKKNFCKECKNSKTTTTQKKKINPKRCQYKTKSQVAEEDDEEDEDDEDDNDENEVTTPFGAIGPCGVEKNHHKNVRVKK